MKYWIDPVKSTVDNLDTWNVNIITGDREIAAGGAIRLTIHGREAWPIFQTDRPAESFMTGNADDSLKDSKGKFKARDRTVPACYTTISSNPEISFRPVCTNTYMDRTITFFADRAVPPDSEITIVMGDKSGGGKGCNPGHLSQKKRFWLWIDFDGRDNFKKCSDHLCINFSADRTQKHKLILPSIIPSGSETTAKISAFDKHGNPAEDDSLIEIKAHTGQLARDARLAVTGGKGSLPVSFESEGIVRIESNSDISNPAKVVSDKEAHKLFWGDLHGHSFLAASLDYPTCYFEYARDVEKLDFVSMPDNDGNMIERKLYGLPQSPFWNTRETAWSIVKYLHDYYHDPGSFVTILGWEWTSVQINSPKTSTPCGHRVVYFPSNDGALFPHTEEAGNNIEKLWDRLEGLGAFTIPHHPAYPLDRFLTGVDWRYSNPKMEFLVEIYSKQGTSEYPGNPNPVNNPRAEGHVQTALNKGYRLGFVGGSDTHVSRPGGIIMEPVDAFPYAESGLTAIYAEELTREALLAALKQRRCYATTGHRILVEFSINGKVMGQQFRAEPGGRLAIQASAAGTAPIEKIEIIKNGAVLHTRPGGKYDIEFDIDDNAPANGSAYYYLRVTQEDGNRAWSSPIWVDTAKD